MKLLKRIGLAAAIIYGWFGIICTLFLTIMYTIPLGSSMLHMLAIFSALPLLLYPFWWMGVSFIAGILVTVFWMKSREKKKYTRPKTVKKWNGKGYDDVELEPLRTDDGKLV